MAERLSMKAQTDPSLVRGTPEEQNLFRDVHNHYTLSKQDLEIRMTRKNGFNDADKLFASYINENDWPYNSMIFDPKPYKTIIEKSARLIGNKPKGRLVPREGGDSLGAYINNELLSYQWDDTSRLGESQLSKWIMADQNTRKYGSCFILEKWRYETRIIDGKKKLYYDGPESIVCNARDVLANPSYSFVNKWFQYREYLTLQEMKDVNDAARTGPKYKNLNVLEEALKDDGKSTGDRRDTQYTIENKAIRGLTDYLGSDKINKTLEVVTEYRPTRWITFAPRYGIILKDIPNPYKHGEIPVVHLKYYPLPDDLYGVSELEPVSKLIRGINSLYSNYIDTVSIDTNPPLMVNPVNVRMHTLEFTPQAKWLMNNPGQDVQRLQTNTATTNNFSAAYAIMVGSLNDALGEGSQGMSSVNPTQDQGRVTATEIKDTSFTRNVRDNMNQIYLSEALKKEIGFWHSMNQQFLFTATSSKQKVIRIVGKDAIDFFKTRGLGDIQPTEEEILGAVDDPNALLPQGPRFPAMLPSGDVVPKFIEDDNGMGGDLVIEPGDLMGTYDYIPDIETMQAPSDSQVEQKLTAILGTITNPAVMQMLAAEGKKPKIMDILIKLYESTKVIKDAESYFEDMPQPMMGQQDVNQINQGGLTPPEAGVPDQGNGVPTGMGGSVPTMA